MFFIAIIETRGDYLSCWRQRGHGRRTAVPCSIALHAMEKKSLLLPLCRHTRIWPVTPDAPVLLGGWLAAL